MKKNVFFACLLMLVSTFVQAQKFRGLDKSPMDMAYCPDNFAHDRKAGDKAFVRVTYSRPAKKERSIFGTTVPFKKVWRVGANESTVVKFYQDVQIQGKTIKAGEYSLFMIPDEQTWTIILNTDLDVWGAFSYDASKDVLQIKVTPKTTESPIENLSIQFTPISNKQTTLQMAWDSTLIEIPIQF